MLFTNKKINVLINFTNLTYKSSNLSTKQRTTKVNMEDLNKRTLYLFCKFSTTVKLKK